MSRSRFRPYRNYPTPVTVTDDIKSHTLALQQIVEWLSVGKRDTRDLRNSFVRVGELEDIGLIQVDASGNFNLLISGTGTGVSDHGALTGLTDDDHTQYYNATRGDARYEQLGHAHDPADHGTLTGLTDNDHPQYVKRHGFVVDEATWEVTMSYDASARAVTITPTGATFDIWVGGVKYTKTGAQVSGAHDTTSGGHFLTYDSAGNLQWSTTPWAIDDDTAIPVAYVYWNNEITDGAAWFEAHTFERSLVLHKNLHFTQGTKASSSGFAIADYALATDTDAAVTPSIASGTVYDEDIVRTAPAVANGGPYTIWWRQGTAGLWRWSTTDSFPFKAGTYPQRNYDAGGGTGWTLADISGTGLGQWINVWAFTTTGMDSQNQTLFVVGQTAYTSLAAAQGESLSNISWGTVPFQEIAPLYKITLQAKSTFGGTYKAEIVAVERQLGGGASVISALTPTTHNSLSGRSDADVHPASSITVDMYGDMYSTDVQSALEELAAEKAGIASNETITGEWTFPDVLGVTYAAGAVTNMVYGNSTDLPTHLMWGAAEVAADNEHSIQLWALTSQTSIGVYADDYAYLDFATFGKTTNATSERCALYMGDFRGTQASVSASQAGDETGEIIFYAKPSAASYAIPGCMRGIVESVGAAVIGGGLKFFTHPGSGDYYTALVERMYLKGNGDVALGTDGFISFDEHASAPSTPSSGRVALYAKADGKMYFKDDAGTETACGGGASGARTIGAAWGGAAALVAADCADVVVHVPVAGTITGVYVYTQGGTGSCVIDIWKDTYANYPPTVADTITASAKPTVSSGVKSSDTTLTGWTKTLSAGDILKFHVDSTSTFTNINVVVTYTPS